MPAGQFNLNQKSVLSLGMRHLSPVLSCFQPHQSSPSATIYLFSLSTVDVHRSTDPPLLFPLCKVTVPWKPVGIDRFTYALPKKEEQSKKNIILVPGESSSTQGSEIHSVEQPQ